MKTYKQQAIELGIWHSQYHTRSLLRHAIFEEKKKIARWKHTAEKFNTTPYELKSLGLQFEDLIKFIKLTERLPTKEEIIDIHKHPTFKLWFSIVYMNAKTSEESVSWGGSEASKLWNSL